jgi:hypothetical protein
MLIGFNFVGLLEPYSLMDEHPLGLEFELFMIAFLAHHRQPPTCTGDNYIEKFFNIPTL